ncbi:uncharacterized protein LOC124137824 [Haliotis rufescens]|uniref:uncharacterized protein LOC124137824 n=1 Tax=Haliotis rufescens TaxID=6454 RepID=UPI00201F8E6D|nr:uncharacterized protein LOC124137824 [Haliotis rufescens]
MDKPKAFELDFGEPERKLRPPPQRLTRVNVKPSLTREQIEEKQTQAELRRKQQEQFMIERVRKTREECIKLDKKVQKLMDQDAKRRGLPGSEGVKIMSSREAKKTAISVVEEFANISSKISSRTDTVDKPT